MAFGIKQVKVTTSKNHTVESFYEAIKDHEFTPGKPELVKQGFAYVIAFPAIDKNNQCQIVQGWFGGKEGNKFTVMRNEEAGTGNIVKNAVIDDLSGGFTALGKIGGKNNQLAQKQVDEVVAELNKMGL
jgi:hypothetical protein